MIIKSEIKPALAAADAAIMVETNQQLAEVLALWQDCEVIGIDTEFVRERTYRADLGLVQLSDGHTVWLVDPLKTGPIDGLAQLFENPNVVKVLHAPSEDLDVLLYTTGACPEPLFDTQVACSMLGESLQLSYHHMVNWLLDITIDKGETRSNWLKRPLRPAQLHYAALDVCLLPMIYRELAERLENANRSSWLEEDCRRLLSRAFTELDPAESWMKIRGSNRLSPASCVILQKLAEWREIEADRRNLAKGFVIKNPELLAIAYAAPQSISQLTSLGELHPKVVERYGKRLLELVDEAQKSGLQVTPLRSLDPQQRNLLAGMKKRVAAKAKELQVEPALLASRRELENLILTDADTPLPERFLGWRKDLITNDLVELMEKFR
jgi:ribonuclease D